MANAYTVEHLVKALQKFDPQDEVLVSAGSGTSLRNIIGIRGGDIRTDYTPVLNNPSVAVLLV